jgi:hypothetical protein
MRSHPKKKQDGPSPRSRPKAGRLAGVGCRPPSPSRSRFLRAEIQLGGEGGQPAHPHPHPPTMCEERKTKTNHPPRAVSSSLRMLKEVSNQIRQQEQGRKAQRRAGKPSGAERRASRPPLRRKNSGSLRRRLARGLRSHTYNKVLAPLARRSPAHARGREKAAAPAHAVGSGVPLRSVSCRAVYVCVRDHSAMGAGPPRSGCVPQARIRGPAALRLRIGGGPAGGRTPLRKRSRWSHSAPCARLPPKPSMRRSPLARKKKQNTAASAA